MKKSHWFHTGAAACALAILCLAAAPSHGAVTADPAKTTFTSPQQSATIKLMKDGTPVAAKDIRGVAVPCQRSRLPTHARRRKGGRRDQDSAQQDARSRKLRSRYRHRAGGP